MDWITQLLGIVFFIGMGILIFLTVRHEARRFRALGEKIDQEFAGRTPLSPEEFAAACELNLSADVADRVRKVVLCVAEEAVQPGELHLKPSVLRPDDWIWTDLGIAEDSLCLCEMAIELEKEFGVRFHWSDFKETLTLRDIVCLVQEKLAARDAL